MRDLAKARRRIGQLERERLQAPASPIFVPLMVFQTGVQADPDLANTFLAELFELETIPPSHQNYSTNLFLFAKAIHDISPWTYILARPRVHGFPHPKYLRSHANSFFYFRAETYLELTRLLEVVEGWRQAHSLASNFTVVGVAAIDAISFKEQFSISRTGETRG
jgi:hypothetical protein